MIRRLFLSVQLPDFQRVGVGGWAESVIRGQWLKSPWKPKRTALWSFFKKMKKAGEPGCFQCHHARSIAPGGQKLLCSGPHQMYLFIWSLVLINQSHPRRGLSEPLICSQLGLSWWFSVSVPGSGRCPGGGNGNPLQSSCLENPVDRGAWWATVHRPQGHKRDGHDLVTKQQKHR